MFRLTYFYAVRIIGILQGLPVIRKGLTFIIIITAKILLSKQQPLLLVIMRYVKAGLLDSAFSALVGFKIMHCSRISRYFFSLHNVIKSDQDAKDIIQYFEENTVYKENQTTHLIKAICYFSLGKKFEKKAKESLEKAYAEKLKQNPSKFSPSSAQAALEAVKKVLHEKNGIKFFLCSGTLLAAVRNKEFFSWDTDIDIGVFDKDASSKQISALFDKNENFIRVLANKFAVKLTHKNGVVIDVFIHFSTGDFYAHSGGANIWLNKKFRLKEISFCGKKYFAPQNADYYLKENYGDYRSIPLFYHFQETPNLVFKDTFSSRLNNMLRYATSLSGGDRFNMLLAKKFMKESMGFDVNAGKYVVPEIPEYLYMGKKHKL